MLGGAGFLDEAHAAMDLDAEAGHLDADIGAIGLDQRRQQVGAGARRRIAKAGAVGLAGRVIGQRPGGLGERLHPEQHPAHVGEFDDPRRPSLATALDALAGIGHGLLHRPLGDRHALQADIEAGIVHHREHRRHALILFADQPAGRAAIVAIGHDAGRRGVNAELVLDRHAAEVVRRAILHELGHEEQRYAARAGRRVGQAGEDEVHDIVGKVVVAEGDEDLLAGDPVAAVADRLCAALQRPHVGTGLGLGEVHRASPFAGDELGQPGRLQVGRAMMLQRLDCAGGQHHAEREAHIGRAQILHDDDGEGQRQTLPAEFGGARDRPPTALDIAAIGLSKPLRHGDALGRPARADLVADPVQRREHARSELAGALDDRIDHIVRRLGELIVACQFLHADDVADQEFLLLDGRGVGHGGLSTLRCWNGGYSAAA